MELNRIEKLYAHYEDYLLNNSLPFWLKNSLDHSYKGYITSLDREGKRYDTDKSVWFQGRGTWLYSRLYNEVEKRQEWLDAATLGYEFLLKYCFDSDGRMYFQVTADGKPLRKRRYFFSEMFAVMAFSEYYRATGRQEAIDKAREIYGLLLDLYRNPSKTVSKVNTATRSVKSHSPYMMLLCVSQIIREADKAAIYDEVAKEVTDIVLRDFVKQEEKALFETVGLNGERLDSPQGRCINPGHAIESAWFLMHEGLYRKDDIIIRNALNVLDWSLELGWDKEYGGLLSFVDIEGRPPEQLEWDMKLWWPHTETLYALLLAHHITGDGKYEAWYDKVHEWSFSNFGDRDFGEWFGYLHRDGSVSNTLKGSMWKGPFHLPRALLMNMKLLDKMKNKAENTGVVK